MTCRALIERLDEFLEDRLSPADRRAFEDHLRSCDDCRGLIGFMEEGAASIEPPADLVGAILRRTSGSTCGSARAQLCGHVDRLLAPTDDDLVRMHLSGCRECSGLAAAVARLAIDLPVLAEIDPGEPFVPAVLARTSRRPRFFDPWAELFAAGWQRLAHRPRIAWEGAYAGWVILAILFGTPNAPFAGVPGRALALARTVQESVRANDVEDKVGRIGVVASSRWSETKAEVQDSTRGLKTGTEQRLSALWTRLKQKFGTAWSRLASGRAGNEQDKGVRR